MGKYGFDSLRDAKLTLATQELVRAKEFFRRLWDAGCFDGASHSVAKEMIDHMAETYRTLESNNQQEVEFRIYQSDVKK